MYKAAVAMNQRSEHPDTLTRVSNVALVLRHQGKYEATEAMNRRALEEFEKALGPEHLSLLASTSYLALVLRYQGKREAAQAMSRRAVDGRKKRWSRASRQPGKYAAVEERSRTQLSALVTYARI